MARPERLIVLFLLALFAAAPMLSAQDAPLIIEQAQKGVVTICGRPGASGGSAVTSFFQEETVVGNILGSGIVLSSDGLILTAHHTVAGAENISVVLSSLSEFDARVIATESSLDLAILRIQSADLVPLPWRLDMPPVVGETVYALGTPAIFSDDPFTSVSRGIIGAVNRSLTSSQEAREAPFLADLIETDAQLSPGESGGALIDESGRLLGMCLAVYHPTGAVRGRAFALPADRWLRSGVDAMLAGRAFPLGRLGLQVVALDTERSRRLGRPSRQGVQVSYVAISGPAEAAGVAVGDIVTRVNNEPVRLASQFRRIELRLVPGEIARLSVLRGNSTQSVPIEVTVAPQLAVGPPQRLEFHWRGMTLSDITDKIRKEYSLPYKSGIIVIDVDLVRNAYQAGLRKGDVIVEINNTPVGSLSEFTEAVRLIRETNVVRVRTTEGIGHIQGETR